MNHHPHDTFWIAGILAQLPSAIHGSVNRTYSHLYEQQGRQAANHFLLDVEHYAVGKTVLTLDDDTLSSKADRLAKLCTVNSLAKARAYMDSVGYSLPSGDSEAAILARLACPIWWERTLRRQQDREQESLFIQCGFISRHAQTYCSSALLARIQARQARALALLEQLEAVSDEGDVLPMLDVLKRSVANPAVRRAELMVRMRGFEDYAQSQGHIPMFYTLTCPSKYHRYSGRELNDKYEGATPRDAQAYLVKLWSQIRAKLKRDDLPVYGFRVAEPHADGTPHWHMLLFMHPSHEAAITSILWDYALAVDGDEPGADQYRFEAVQIDASKGSATGYIAKYVSKNIDGFGLTTDEETGKPADDSAKRVRAWASVWGIRQFQQLGGAPVGVWRELRRMDTASHDLLEQARQAADSGDWCGYLTLQGGAEANRKSQPIRIFTLESIDEATGAIQTNRYGELVERVQGLAVEGVPVVDTRIKVWEIREREDAKRVDLAAIKPALTDDGLRALAVDGFSFFPWSTVNNCTQGARQEARREAVQEWRRIQRNPSRDKFSYEKYKTEEEYVNAAMSLYQRHSATHG